jgi:hypothetical protein
MSDTLPTDLNSAALGIGRHVSGVADPFDGLIDELRISHIERSDGWIETTWNTMSDPGAFAAAGAEEQEGGESPPLAGAGVVVCLMGSDRGRGDQRRLRPVRRPDRRGPNLDVSVLGRLAQVDPPEASRAHDQDPQPSALS